MELLSGENKTYLINQVKGILHISQPWFHGDISRDEAERRFQRAGHEDGKYLYV